MHQFLTVKYANNSGVPKIGFTIIMLAMAKYNGLNSFHERRIFQSIETRTFFEFKRKFEAGSQDVQQLRVGITMLNEVVPPMSY